MIIKHNTASPRVLKQSDSNKKLSYKEPSELACEHSIRLRNEIKNIKQEITTKEIKEYAIFAKPPKIACNAYLPKLFTNLKLHIIPEEYEYSNSSNLVK